MSVEIPTNLAYCSGVHPSNRSDLMALPFYSVRAVMSLTLLACRAVGIIKSPANYKHLAFKYNQSALTLPNNSQSCDSKFKTATKVDVSSALGQLIVLTNETRPMTKG